MAVGTPEEIAHVAESFTGQYLRRVLPEAAVAGRALQVVGIRVTDIDETPVLIVEDVST